MGCTARNSEIKPVFLVIEESKAALGEWLRKATKTTGIIAGGAFGRKMVVQYVIDAHTTGIHPSQRDMPAQYMKKTDSGII